MRRFPGRAFLPICACLLLDGASAQKADPGALDSQRIAEVRFEPERQPLSKEQIARILPLQPDGSVSAEDIRGAIKRLYATGRYAFIQVNAEPAPTGVSLVIETRPQWFIGPVQVETDFRSPPNPGQVENAARLRLGEPFAEEDIARAVEGIQDLLRRNGFFLGTVLPEMSRNEEFQQVSFRFVVKSGPRARLTHPEITGDPRLSPPDIAKAAGYRGWFGWKRATRRNVQRGMQRIRRMFEKQDRLTARVSIEDTRYDRERNRATPILNVQGGPKVTIRTVGADIRQRRLRRYIPVFDIEEVNRDLLVLGARNLRDYFQGRGYFEAEVDFQVIDAGADQQEIVYVVTQGPRYRLVDVIVQGNQYFDDESIRERMFLLPARFLVHRRGRYSEGLARRDEEAIARLYQANGFRDAQVAIQTTGRGAGTGGDVTAVVTIEEGPQYFVSGLKLHGVEAIDQQALMPALASQPGQPFSEYNVGLDRDYILTAYQQAGYPEAAFEWRMSEGPGPHEISVEYFIAEGERRFVRQVLISGNRVTRPAFIENNVLLGRGDPLSWTEMGRTQRRLYELGVFTKVNMAVQNPQGETENKFVLFDLDEGNRYSLAIGVGAEFGRIGGGNTTTFDQPAGATGFAPRASFEVSRLNMFGLGHSLNLKTRYSTINRRVLLNYLAPRFMNVEGRHLSITGLWDETFDVRTFQARRIEGALEWAEQISRATTVFARYSWRDARVDEETLKINPQLVPLLAQTARVGMLAGSLLRDRRDNPTDATRGDFATADFGVSAGIFGSRQDFTRFLGRYAKYFSLRRNWVLAIQTQFGMLNPFAVPAGVSSEDAVPLPERLFGGGSTSHRGFPDNQAGPRDLVTGFPIGGNAQLFHNTELRFPFLTDNIDGVLFHDFGNTFSSLDSISFRVHQRDLTDFNYMVHAVGFGIRYRTPVGPVRIDLAWSINSPRFIGFKGTREELLFNQGVRTLQRISRFQFFFSVGQAF